MRTCLSTLSISILALLGCGSYEAPHSTDSTAASISETVASDSDNGPVIFGYDAAMRRELRPLFAAYYEQNKETIPADVELPVDADEAVDLIVDKWTDATLKRPSREFDIQPDAEGNYIWPDEHREKLVKPIRAKFDTNKFFEEHDAMKIPAPVSQLVQEYETGTLTPARRELLFLIVVATYADDGDLD